MQHINADGTESFPHNGVAVSTNASQVRVEPSAAYNPQTKDIFVSWEEEDSVQSMSGVYAQRIDATGTRQWSDNGLAIVPLQVNAEVSESTVQIGNDAFVFWIEQQVDLTGTIQGVKLDATGAYACSQFPVSSLQVSKSRAGNRTGVEWEHRDRFPGLPLRELPKRLGCLHPERQPGLHARERGPLRYPVIP